MMNDGPTIFTIPRYLAIRAARLRMAARAHVLLTPLAIWAPLLVRFRGLRAAVIGVSIFLGFWAILQLAPMGAPRTMRRRYRRLTGQAGLIALAAFCLLALSLLLIARVCAILGSRRGEEAQCFRAGGGEDGGRASAWPE
ncbi:MAG: hypothetical protein LC748_17350 [Thermomicrobia bacterium]|nr:hypothetical protein [Thermomicrobia bacterium]